jgi:hypothetical protein
VLAAPVAASRPVVSRCRGAKMRAPSDQAAWPKAGSK